MLPILQWTKLTYPLGWNDCSSDHYCSYRCEATRIFANCHLSRRLQMSHYDYTHLAISCRLHLAPFRDNHHTDNH